MFDMYGDPRENVFDMYGDLRENLLEILVFVIILSMVSSVCGHTLDCCLRAEFSRLLFKGRIFTHYVSRQTELVGNFGFVNYFESDLLRLWSHSRLLFKGRIFTHYVSGHTDDASCHTYE